MLPVTLASAEAKASSEFCEDCLPHSFSTMPCFSLEAIDITAALARCAMSRIGDPDPFAVLSSTALASASFGAAAGTFKASLVAGVAIFGFVVSAGFSAATVFGASAGGEAAASFVVSTGWGATDLGSSPCGADAANRSLNISELATFSGAGITSGRCSNDANISLKAGCTGRAATAVGLLTTGASKAALFTVG